MNTQCSRAPAGSVTELAAFEPAEYLRLFVSAVAFFVRMTRLMKNVRHDCLLNLLVCGHDPVDRDAARAANSPLSIRFILAVTVSEEKGFFVYQLFPLACLLTIVPVAAFSRAEWALRMQRYGRGGVGAAWKVHISTSPPCWIKSIGSDIAHPEQTLTCFSTLSQTKTTSCRVEEEIRGGRGAGGGKENIEICKGFPSDADSFMGLRTPFIYDSLCLVLFVWVLTPSEMTLTRQKLDSHTHTHSRTKKSYKARDVRGVQEDTQWYKIANWITFFGTQNQSLTFPARTMHKGGGWGGTNHAFQDGPESSLFTVSSRLHSTITGFSQVSFFFFSLLWRTWSAGAKEEEKEVKEKERMKRKVKRERLCISLYIKSIISVIATKGQGLEFHSLSCTTGAVTVTDLLSPCCDVACRSALWEQREKAESTL